MLRNEKFNCSSQFNRAFRTASASLTVKTRGAGAKQFRSALLMAACWSPPTLFLHRLLQPALARKVISRCTLPLRSSLLLKALLYLCFSKPTAHRLANTLACKTRTSLHKHTLFTNALVHTHIESLISAPFSCFLGPLPRLQRSLGGRSFHSLAQWAPKSHISTHMHITVACHQGSAS